MKHLIFLLFTFSIFTSLKAQYFRITNDSTLMKSELILESATKTKTGAFIKNKGNGRTEFAYAVDSAYISNDTIYFRRGDGALGVKLAGGSGSQDLSNYVQKISQPPTTSLTGGVTQELLALGGNLTYTLSWTAGRQSGNATINATGNLTTINVAGANQTFVNPGEGGSVSGTKIVSVVRNTNTSFSNNVTTADGKTAAASTSFTFLPRRYWFYTSTTTPASTDVIAAAGGGSELSNSISKSTFTITPSGGNRYLSYAYPTNQGALSSINIGGFESILSFTQRTVSITNASGFTQNYFVYTSNNLLPTTTFNSIQ